MQKTPISEIQRDLVFQHLPKSGQQSVFKALSSELQNTVVELLEKNLVNGELPEKFDQGEPKVSTYLKEEMQKLDKKRDEEEKKRKAQLEKEEAEEKALMENLNNIWLGMLTMEFMRNFFRLSTSESQTYDQTLAKLCEFNEHLKRTYLAPIFSAHNVTDEKVQKEIHELALKKLYTNIFGIPSCQDNYGATTQQAAYAQLGTIKYQESLFGFTITDTDEKVMKVMQSKRDEIIQTAAKTYAALSGNPVENIIPVLNKYTPIVLWKLRDAVLKAA